jgi:hypothetical protein
MRHDQRQVLRSMETLCLIVAINLVSWSTVALGRLVLRLSARGIATTAILNAIRPVFAFTRPRPSSSAKITEF